jgi:hypothetical protein
MTELDAQLRALVDGGAEPVTMRDVRRRTRRSAAEVSTRPVWLAVAAAAALVVVIGGAVALVARDTTSDPVAGDAVDQPVDDPFDDGRPFAATAEHAGDHWHALLGVNVCGQWLDPVPEFEVRAAEPNVRAGIHTHGDGFIHVHPFSADETGANATLGRFFEFAGLTLGRGGFEWWTGVAEDPAAEQPGVTSWSDGRPCGDDEPGLVRWSVNGEEQVGNPADYRLQDRDCVVVAFLPEGRDIGTPPHASSSAINDGSPSGPITCGSAR